ncbi:beta-ketoacyl-ACP synthase III [Clostridium rectalis]|uniref:beta-ketoacyl-ACP synthase III n=1 Tax=Clostridium rectalis TaxID=2040295 RepID=UPI000F63FA9D|nr:beta-ketoacyl-ACP synthase III [Clostridium rectalis]
MREVKIVATGSYVPEKILTNDKLSEVIDTNDEWIKSRTGISKRRVSINENTSDIATKAAMDAIYKSDIKVEDLDLIIVGTATPDCYTPSTACIVQKNIGAVNATCFDISAACSGFIYAVNIACEFIKTGSAKKALVIGAEVLSKILDWNDRGTCVLFGDGAGAAILSSSDKSGIMAIYTGSDGSGENLLKCNAASLGINNNSLSIMLNKDKYEENNFLTMEGREIFKFAVRIIEESIKKLLEMSKLNMDDIDYIIPHQANLRIIDFVSRKLNIDKNKFFVNLQDYGNTSAASIPIALNEMSRKGLLKKGDRILMVGFGGGLTWGGAIVKW